jgi:hypothetical protein
VARWVVGFVVGVVGVEREVVERFVEGVEAVNKWLEEEFWGEGGMEWVVGEEKGLEMRKGTLWYGDGGETVRVGKGV